MQFKITYARPNQPRVDSGWVKADESHREHILYTYEIHGFKASEIDTDRFILSHPTQGIRAIQFKK